MSESTERDLKNWRADDSRDVMDTLFVHFREFDKWDADANAREMVRLYEMMFWDEDDSKIEEWSPLDSVFVVLATTVRDQTLVAVASMMGIPAERIEALSAYWHEDGGQDKHPAPIPFGTWAKIAGMNDDEFDAWISAWEEEKKHE